MIKKLIKRMESKWNYLKIAACNVKYYFHLVLVNLSIIENRRMEIHLGYGRIITRL